MVITPHYGKKETKFDQGAVGLASIGSGIVRNPITSLIAQGSDIFRQRLGRSLRVKRIMWRSQLLGGQTNSVADDAYNTVRLTVVRCLPGATMTSYTVCNVLDTRLSTSAGLLEVLYDRTRVIRATAKDSTGYIAAAEEWEFDIKCDIQLDYGSTAAAAPINQEIVMFAISDSVAVVNPGFANVSTYAIEYVDDS